MEDNVNRPNHYQNIAGVEAIDILNDVVEDLQGVQAAMLWNTMKYLLRFQKKNGVEDLKKAQNYLRWLIDDIESVEANKEDKEDKEDKDEKDLSHATMHISDVDDLDRPTKLYFKWYEHAKCTQVSANLYKTHAYTLNFKDVLPGVISIPLDYLFPKPIEWVNLSKTVLRSVMPYDDINNDVFKYCLELEWKKEEK